MRIFIPNSSYLIIILLLFSIVGTNPLFAQSTIEKDSLNLSKKITKNNLTNSKVIEADSIITPKKKGFSFKSIGNFFTSLFKKKKDTIAPNTAKIDSLQTKVVLNDSINSPKKGFSLKPIGNFFTSLFKKKKDTIAPNTAKIDSLQTKVVLNDSITPQTKKFSFKTIGNFFSSIFKKKKGNKKDSINNVSIAKIDTVIKKPVIKKVVKKPIQFLRTGNVLTGFNKKEIDLKTGNIISNVLRVVNLDTKNLEFKVNILIPSNWMRIDDKNKLYSVAPKDTIIVPIVISPTKLISGNTEIIINTFLIGSEGQQLASDYFMLKTTKKTSWKLLLENNRDVYFKNGESSKRFDFSIRNEGNHQEDLLLNYTIPKNDLFLSDTLNQRIKKKNISFRINPNQEKLFNYNATIVSASKRNLRRISLNSYSPNQKQFKKTHSLIVSAKELASTSKSNKKTKINFIKLPNKIKSKSYGYPYIPLTLELNAQNVLDAKSFLSLQFTGIKQLDNNTNIVYNTQLNYSSTLLSNNLFKNTPWYVGYFSDKKTIEVGQIAGNLIGIASAGKGIKASYQLNDKNKIGAFYVNSSGFFDNNSSITFGAWHEYRKNNSFYITSKVGRNNNSLSNRSVNVVSVQPVFKINKRHSFNIIGALTNKDQENRPENFEPNGLLFSTNYTSSFYKRKLRVNFGITYNDKHYSFGGFERYGFNQRINYRFKKNWQVTLASNYQSLNSYSANTQNLLYKQELFFNNLIFTSKNKTGVYQPGIFYEYRALVNTTFHARGLSFRYSNFKFKNNFISSVFMRAGYTMPVDDNFAMSEENYFNFELATLIRYRTWNFTTRYNLGAFSSITTQALENTNLDTPQSLRLALQNQHAFKNKHFVIENSLIYSYNNIFRNNTLGIFPIGYYFTNSGWRFGIGANYTFSSSNFNSVFDDVQNPNLNLDSNIETRVTSNFNLNFNLRKEFGIPIPYLKSTTANTNFISFLDINGNGKKDKNEDAIQNVVIKIDNNEVLTDVNGKAAIDNLEKNKYKLETFSLEKLNGWFPNVNDSISIEKNQTVYIPYVRGVKVYGDVILNRQKIAVADKQPVDLSRIKITATNGKFYSTLTDRKGHFEFYLPYGDYVITMDKNILNDRFSITHNNIPLNLKSSQNGVYLSFYIVEKRRKVIFKNFTKKEK